MMMAERTIAAILGAGRIAGRFGEREDLRATTHAGAMGCQGTFDLVAVHDCDEERARTFAERWGAEAYDDVELLLRRSNPQLVVIASPDSTHCSLAKAVLGSSFRPRVLVIEKPPCVSRTELTSLLATASSQGDTCVVVNVSRRFDNLHRELVCVFEHTPPGDLVSGTVTYYGGWLHNGIHAVDTLRMLLGGELRVLASAVGAFGRLGDPCRDVDVASNRWPNARLAFRGFDERVFQLFELDLRFTEGRVRLDNFGERIVSERVVVNSIGERELQLLPLTGDFDNSTPMMNLYRACAAYMVHGDERVFAGAELQTVARSMEVLFDAE